MGFWWVGAVSIAILVVWSGHNRYRAVERSLSLYFFLWSGHYRYTSGLERLTAIQGGPVSVISRVLTVITPINGLI